MTGSGAPQHAVGDVARRRCSEGAAHPEGTTA